MKIPSDDVNLGVLALPLPSIAHAKLPRAQTVSYFWFRPHLSSESRLEGALVPPTMRKENQSGLTVPGPYTSSYKNKRQVQLHLVEEQ